MAVETARKKKTREIVKQEFLNYFKENDDLVEPDTNATADTITDSIEAFRLKQRYQKIMET